MALKELTNYVLMPGADYQALCNAIRAKTGKTEALKSGDLASEVESITGGGGGAEITEFLPTTTFTNDYFSDLGVFVYFIPLEAEMMAAWVENRKPVTVVYDGEEYNLAPQVLTGVDGSQGVCVGNLSAFGGAGNNEPFAVVSWNINGVDGLLIGSTVDTAPTQHTIRIYQEASVSMEGVYTVTFMSEDGSSVLYKRLVVDGDDCANVVDRGLLDTPTKESTAQYEYTYSGWSLTSGGAADANALKSVTADRTVYAAFTSAVRYYTITYYDSDGSTVLKTESLPYGAVPSYTPTKDGYAFEGWTPNLTAVTGDASYAATWKVKESLNDYTWTELSAMTLDELKEKFVIGDTKSPSSSSSSKWTLIGFNQDVLADGSGNAKMTFLWSGLCPLGSIVNAWMWSSSDVYFPDSTLYSEISSYAGLYSDDLSENVKTVSKKYVSDASTMSISTVDMKIFPVSLSELGYLPSDTVGAEGDCYEYFSSKENTDVAMSDGYPVIYQFAEFFTRSRNTSGVWYLPTQFGDDNLGKAPSLMSFGTTKKYTLVAMCI